MPRRFFDLGHARLGLHLLLVPLLAGSLGLVNRAFADDWPQWLGPRRDGVWREDQVLNVFPEGGPKVLWRAKVGGGYAGPAVAEGRVYLLDRLAKTDDKRKPIANADGSLPGSERVLCFDAKNGQLVWKHEYDRPYKISYPVGPRTTPLVKAGRVYALGAMGNLMCLDAANGNVIWERDLAKDYQTNPPVWGFSGHPLLVGEKLVCLVGGEGSTAVAFNKDDGKEIWCSLTAKEVGYAPPVLVEQDGVQQLIVWHDTAVNALEVDTGKRLWSAPFPEDGQPARPAVPIITPAVAGDRLLVSNFYKGSLMLRLSGGSKPKVIWRADKNDPRHKEGLNALMTTPVIRGRHLYGISGDGELRCLSAETGKVVWRTYQAIDKRPAVFGTCFIVQNNDRYFLFNDQGELIIARLTPEGYEELDRAKLLEPTGFARGRNIVWSHPAFAHRSMFARNDRELIRVDLTDPVRNEK